MLGAVIFAFCYYLFSSIGAKIVAVFSVLIGFIFMTELSLGDFFAKIGKGIAAMTARTKSRLIEFRDRRQKESEGDTVDKLFEEQDVAKDAVNEDPVIPVIEDFADIAYSFDQKQQKQDDPSVASEEKEN